MGTGGDIKSCVHCLELKANVNFTLKKHGEIDFWSGCKIELWSSGNTKSPGKINILFIGAISEQNIQANLEYKQRWNPDRDEWVH